MAAYETTRTAPLGAITTYRFVQFVINIIAAVDGTLPDEGWKTPAHAGEVTRRFAGVTEELASLLAVPATALDKLSDRELTDIGLCRGDIALIGTKDRI